MLGIEVTGCDLRALRGFNVPAIEPNHERGSTGQLEAMECDPVGGHGTWSGW